MEEGSVQDFPHELRLVCYRKMANPCRREPLCSLLIECLPLPIGHVVSAYQGRPHGIQVVVREEGPWGARVGFPISLYPFFLYLQFLGLDLRLPPSSVEGGDHVRGPRNGVCVGLYHLVNPAGRSVVVAHQV